MIYPNSAKSTQSRHARRGALAIAELAGWRLIQYPEPLPPPLADAFCDPEADLVLVPWAEGTPFCSIAQVLGQRGGAAVMVMPGRTIRGEVTFYASVARCARGQIDWYHGLRLWVNAKHQDWLVPDPDGEHLDGACFRLARAPLRPAGPPWSHPFMHGFGFGNADMQLRELMARR